MLRMVRNRRLFHRGAQTQFAPPPPPQKPARTSHTGTKISLIKKAAVSLPLIEPTAEGSVELPVARKSHLGRENLPLEGRE